MSLIFINLIAILKEQLLKNNLIYRKSVLLIKINNIAEQTWYNYNFGYNIPSYFQLMS